MLFGSLSIQQRNLHWWSPGFFSRAWISNGRIVTVVLVEEVEGEKKKLPREKMLVAEKQPRALYFFRHDERKTEGACGHVPTEQPTERRASLPSIETQIRTSTDEIGLLSVGSFVCLFVAVLLSAPL